MLTASQFAARAIAVIYDLSPHSSHIKKAPNIRYSFLIQCFFLGLNSPSSSIKFNKQVNVLLLSSIKGSFLSSCSKIYSSISLFSSSISYTNAFIRRMILDTIPPPLHIAAQSMKNPNAKKRAVDTIWVIVGVKMQGNIEPMLTDITYIVAITKHPIRNTPNLFNFAAKTVTNINVYQ